MQTQNQTLGLALHAQTLAAMPDAVFVHDDEGRLVEVNRLACELVGYSRAALLTMMVVDIERKWKLAQLQDQWEKLVPGQSLTMQGQHRHQDGHVFPVELHIGLLAANGPRLYVVSARDMSAMHALQLALRVSEERYQQAARAAQFGIFIDNLLSCHVYWSKEFRAIVGVEMEAMPKLSGSVTEFVYPDDHEFVQMALVHARNPAGDGKLDSVHRIVRRADGVVRWVQVLGKVEFDGTDGQRRAREVSGLLIDITDRMKVKEELQESQQRFELALNAAPIALFEQDTALRYTWHCNANLGFQLDEMMGKTDADFMDAQSAQLLQALKCSVLATGTPVRQDISVLRRDGALVHLDVSLRVRRDASGEVIGIRGTAFDITEARNAKARLEELNAELKLRSLEVESVNLIRSRFLSTVSHELRTPLHTLLGYLRLAMLESHGDVREHLQIVERSGRQLLKQIGDLLSFNRLDKQLGALQPEGVELRVFIEQIERTGLILAQAGANRFCLQIAADLPAIVRLDEYRLMQVLDNLISNACKFTSSGQITLVICREAVPSDDAYRCHLRFEVQDSGLGIALKDQEKIFDPFVRLEGNQFSPGLGLGLSIARQWVRAMGSDIQVVSSPGQGSRFFFVLELPVLSSRAQADSLECVQYCSVLKQRMRTLLVVDDEAENRLLLRHVCEQWGYQVVEAEGVMQALDTLSHGALVIDAILVDQFMVEHSGWDLLRRLRQGSTHAQLPVVLVSASEPRRPDGFPSDLAFDLMLGKPLDYQVLACFLCQSLKLVVCAESDCAWQMAPSTEAPRTVLAVHDLQYFRQLLGMGRVMRIAQWADELAQRDSRYRQFSEQAVRLSKAADLVGLERLAQQVESDVRAAGV